MDLKTAQRDMPAHLFNQLTRLTFSTTKLRDRFAGTLRPFSRHATTLSPYCQRRCAVARPMPNRQQIAFHGVRSDRAQTSLACAGSSQRNQASASSIRVMAMLDGGGRRIGRDSRPTQSANSTVIEGHVLK